MRKKIKIDFQKLTDFSVLGVGVFALPLSWYVLYYLLGTISKYVFVPWDMTLTRPSGENWIRMVNDFFDTFPGSEIFPAIIVGTSIWMFYNRIKKEKDYYLPIFFVAVNVLFGIISYVVISLISKIAGFIITTLGYSYGLTQPNILTEIKSLTDSYGYIKSIPGAIALTILIPKYFIYLKYENISLFVGVQRRVLRKVVLPNQPVTDMLKQNISDFRAVKENEFQLKANFPPEREVEKKKVERKKKVSERELRTKTDQSMGASFGKNMSTMTLPRPNVRGMSRISSSSENTPATRPPTKIRLPIVGGTVRPYIKVSGEKFMNKGGKQKRYFGKIKFFDK